MVDALGRAMELMTTPIRDLPRLAVEYRNELGRRYGLCGEVCITAFAAYAQCVEGYPVSADAAYRAGSIEEAWFAERLTTFEAAEALFAYAKRQDSDAVLNAGAGI
jgi:hypothetical protein